jgi:1-deoxy-D-xylulose 5-phosphate reductoisomerase
MGAAAKIGFEEFLDGRVNFAELIQIIMDGMDELIYREIAQALMASVNLLP